MEVFRPGQKHLADFKVFLPNDRGVVGLRCKAQKKTIYRWELCKDPVSNNAFTAAQFSDVCSTFIDNLESQVLYWFRVVLINKTGEHPQQAVFIATL
jgi:hypothetical protein